MNDEGAPHDSGFDDSGPFADTPPAGGVSLESALRHFGPAAFEDLIPRLQALAAVLDEAHDAGFVHGRLHPSKIVVTERGTYLMGQRVPASDTLTPAADQAAFAVIAYEWMFGRRVSPGAAVAPSPPSGVDRGRLSQALTRALSQEGDRQFASITDFVAALEKAQIPELPLMAAAPDAEDPVEPFTPESPAPDLEVIKKADEAPAAAAVPAWHPPPRQEAPRFGGFALILAAIVGAIVGFAAGYMARPRALQQPVPAEQASAPGTETSLPPAVDPPRVPEEGKAAARDVPARTLEAARIGRLLVRSTPSGASVSVDGVARGVTPVAIRDLDLGSRVIAVTRRGYQNEERRIVLTKARPSRTVDVRLAAAAAPAPEPRPGTPPRPSTPASLGKPAATTGVLVIESQPAGASVLVNGKPSGTTPMTITDLAPGEYRVTMTLKGFREFATTVRVVAGERARAAARLTEQEQP